MKKLLLPILLISIVIFSCKKSSNNTTVSIVGKWHFTADTIIFYIPGFANDTYTNTFQSTNYVQFNSDGSGMSATQVAGGAPGETATDNFTYKVSGSTLTLNFPAVTSGGVSTPAYSASGPIRVLTSNKLVLDYTETYTDTTGTSKIEEIDYLAK